MLLDLQIKHLTNGIFVHQSTYTGKILKRFYMDKTHPLNIPMQVRSLDVKKEYFDLKMIMKNSLVRKYHILVQLVHLCILLIIQDQILHFQ